MKTKTLIGISCGSLILLYLPMGIFISTCLIALVLGQSLANVYGPRPTPVLPSTNSLTTIAPNTQHQKHANSSHCCINTKINAIPGCDHFSSVVCHFMRLGNMCQHPNEQNQ